ncbi:LysR substrate-binding domain-containing protein [Pseudomonas sp. ZM23]|uniref:LysR substrate-binding domain-containing protein n=1 Tax=Pseudomonas triclosanedens TaxID=2961893 RepID=A0ABY7A0V4_9PSED|nr:LysR substrate-binding domain-containing protein [Pseudomonas triclosanedens]MCP8464681.1 LysR substrate-binding domain-containing protein [Pseudomonas triclosanedens]MCP8473612.1 LysR substrate-binding domain-containing protein [Pseudomonas triclosanedens]MCP8478449.1 LysR substrate-binding domain-containing protein [Pseudomonas triclosanedens]WAI50839.1 LysR substrate-binding domain-containing protein [Pseudomonas triclosanedens]
MSALPPLSALRSFEAVARLGSVTLAAAELHVTHSAVSQQMRQLETLLGVTLLLREGRGLRLSEEGRLYALQIRGALQDIAEATRLARARPGEDELVVAVTPSFGQKWLLPRLPRFRQRYPGYRLRLLASLEVMDLRQGLADVAIRIGQGRWEGLAQHRLFEDDLLVVAAPDFNGGRLPQTPEQILRCPRITGFESWLGWCQAAGVALPQEPAEFVVNDSNLSIEAVRQGQGIGLERRSLVAGALESGELVTLSDLRVPYGFPYWLVWPEREATQAKVAAFAEWLQGEVLMYLG